MNKRVFLGTAAGVAAVLSFTGVDTVLAADDTMINACVKKNGSLRIVSDASDCRKRETHLAWNVQGPKGDTGEQGPAGPEGPEGPMGPPGKDSDFMVPLHVDANGVALCEQYACDPTCVDQSIDGRVSMCLVIEGTNSRWSFDQTTGDTEVIYWGYGFWLAEGGSPIFYDNPSCTGHGFLRTVPTEHEFPRETSIFQIFRDGKTGAETVILSGDVMDPIQMSSGELWQWSSSLNGPECKNLSWGTGSMYVTSDFEYVDNPSDYLPTDHVAVPTKIIQVAN